MAKFFTTKTEVIQNFKLLNPRRPAGSMMRGVNLEIFCNLKAVIDRSIDQDVSTFYSLYLVSLQQ